MGIVSESTNLGASRLSGIDRGAMSVADVMGEGMRLVVDGEERRSRPSEGTSFAVRSWIECWRCRALTTSNQVLLTSLIAFACPGMYNALQGMGGGANVDPHIAAQASTAATLTSAICYLVICVPVFEMIGVKAMILGGWPYALYTLSLLYYANTGQGLPVILSGAILGLGSAFFWLVQGAIMISYPLPEEKGKAIATFWIIFNLGGMFGALIAFWQTYYGGSGAGTVSNLTYTVIILIMLLGSCLTATLAAPWTIYRQDGTSVIEKPSPKQSRHWSTEFAKTMKREICSLMVIKQEKRLIYLVPMFFSANFFYSYQQNVVNGVTFDLEARAHNSAFYWSAQTLGGLVIGYIADLPQLPSLRWLRSLRMIHTTSSSVSQPNATTILLDKRSRTTLTYAIVFIFSNMIMYLGWGFEGYRQVVLQEGREIGFGTREHWWGGGVFWGYGLLDSLWQGLIYYLLSTLSESPIHSAKLIAVYKVTQSLGAALAYQLTARDVSSGTQFWVNWGILLGSLICALPAVLGVENGQVYDYVLLASPDESTSPSQVTHV